MTFSKIAFVATMTNPKIVFAALLLLLAAMLQGCGEKPHLCDDAQSYCFGTVRACAPDQDKARSQCKVCYNNVEDSSLPDSEKRKVQEQCLTEQGRQDIPDNIHKETTDHWTGKELLLPLRKFMLKHRSFNGGIVQLATESTSSRSIGSFNSDVDKAVTKFTENPWLKYANDAHHDMSWYLP